MAERGRKPDFNLTAMNMDTRRQGRVGAGWKNDDRSISIRLDPFVQLQGDGYNMTKVNIVLWPNDGDEGYAARQRKKEAASAGTPARVPEESGDDDTPF